jgi:hypothetical protein
MWWACARRDWSYYCTPSLCAFFCILFTAVFMSPVDLHSGRLCPRVALKVWTGRPCAQLHTVEVGAPCQNSLLRMRTCHRLQVSKIPKRARLECKLHWECTPVCPWFPSHPCIPSHRTHIRLITGMVEYAPGLFTTFPSLRAKLVSAPNRSIYCSLSSTFAVESSCEVTFFVVM